MDAAEVAEFPRQEQQAVIDMGLQSGGFLLLVNTEGTVIQSQEVVSAFTDIATHSPLKAKKYCGGSRQFVDENADAAHSNDTRQTAIFAGLSEAEQWLFATTDTPAQ